jgi:hypothetical protein
MNDEIKAAFIPGRIWATRPVIEEPSITLRDWTIIETVEERPSRHFVGYNNAGREGRVSSPIVTFDSETLRGETRTGRVYQLGDGRGMKNGDAEFVLGRWMRMYQVTVEDITDQVLATGASTSSVKRPTPKPE